MVMIMKKREILELNAIFLSLKNFGDTKFKYSILRNNGFINSHVKDLEQIEEGIKQELTTFEEQRRQLIIELGEEKEDGTISINTSDESTIKIFNSKLEELFIEYKEEIESYNKKISEYNEILEEIVEDKFDFRTISIDSFPEEGLESNQLNILIDNNIIKD